VAKRKISGGDFIAGVFASLRSGTAMNPLATQGHVNRAHDARVAKAAAQLAIEGATNNAVKYWLQRINTQPGRRVQYSDQDVTVKVTSGWSRRDHRVTTDIIVADRHNREEHLHIVLDEFGNELINEWRRNH